MVPFRRDDAERAPLLRPSMARAVSRLGPTPAELAACDVFHTILAIRADVVVRPRGLVKAPVRLQEVAGVDAQISWEQLCEPDCFATIVQPLVAKYAAGPAGGAPNYAAAHCLLANRAQFLRDAARLANARVHAARAGLCELVAVRVLDRLAEPAAPSDPRIQADWPPAPAHGARKASLGTLAVEGARQRRLSTVVSTARRGAGELALANALVAVFHPFAGAPPEVLAEEEAEGRTGLGRPCSALELAIVTEAKQFISCMSCQRVMHSIYTGRLSYTPVSFYDIVPDNLYKRKAISLYDPRRAPLLDHYRLRVPRYRKYLELLSFLIVCGLMLVVLRHKEPRRMSGWEIAFLIHTSGWVLDRVATMLEHGWHVFAANLWNGIDVAIMALFLCYAPLRLYGLARHDAAASALALNLLSCEPALIFPRSVAATTLQVLLQAHGSLAFYFMAKSVLVMSLRRMLADFGVLMFAAVWIFVGFWHALCTLDDGRYGVWEVAGWMVNIWFGLDATGFTNSPEFEPTLGPALFLVFACLANTLFITVVVAILSHTFAELNTDAKAEFLFRSAVGIFEGVKSDALFAYQPPLNIPALLFLWSLTPRTFHRTHVFLTRLTNAPLLLLITAFERVQHGLAVSPAAPATGPPPPSAPHAPPPARAPVAHPPTLAERVQRALPRPLQGLARFVEGTQGDIDAVFDYAPDVRAPAAASGVHDDLDDDDAEGDDPDGDPGWEPAPLAGAHGERAPRAARASWSGALRRPGPSRSASPRSTSRPPRSTSRPPRADLDRARGAPAADGVPVMPRPDRGAQDVAGSAAETPDWVAAVLAALDDVRARQARLEAALARPAA